MIRELQFWHDYEKLEKDFLIISEDEEIISLAQKEKKDTFNWRQDVSEKFMPVIRLHSSYLVDQIAEITDKLNLTLSFDPDKSRCSICNGELSRVNKQDVKLEVLKGKKWFRNNNDFGWILWMVRRFRMWPSASFSNEKKMSEEG